MTDERRLSGKVIAEITRETGQLDLVLVENPSHRFTLLAYRPTGPGGNLVGGESSETFELYRILRDLYEPDRKALDKRHELLRAAVRRLLCVPCIKKLRRSGRWTALLASSIKQQISAIRAAMEGEND